MGKKEKQGEHEARRQSKKNRWIGTLLVAGMLALGASAYLGLIPGTEPQPHGVVGGETRPVLPLTAVPIEASAAYAAAAKYPQAMDQVFCYCLCDRWPFHHKSLLSCFTETHGAS